MSGDLTGVVVVVVIVNAFGVLLSNYCDQLLDIFHRELHNSSLDI